MNPFVVVEVDGKPYRTQTLQEGHTNPVWRKTLNIPVKSMGDSIHISCFHQDKKSSEVIGETEIPMYTLCRQGGIQDWFNILYQGKLAGQLFLDTEYTPPQETQR